MIRRKLFSLLVPAAALAGVLAMAPPPSAWFGPPWISIEYPPSPYDATTRDAYLLVHAFHHGTPANFPISGTAEGLVKGERKSIQLSFRQTTRDGTYALKKQWPADGIWTLLITVSQGGDDDVACAIVEIGTGGQVAAVSVPTEDRGSWRVPRKVTVADLEAGLRSRSALASAERSAARP
jgi:hypothetical protein